MIIACMCTFPARGDSILPVIESLHSQVDSIRLCLNEYSSVPSFLEEFTKVESIIPNEDQRDVGKFLNIDANDEDIILYVDDDIIYPDNYAEVMSQRLVTNENAVYGVHGVIYPDAYTGDVAARRVFSFPKALNEDRRVNQLGTGTVALKAKYRPTHEFMAGSQKFVDVRFALHCMNKKLPVICISRNKSWLNEIKHEDSIFSSFTKKWPLKVIKEAQKIAGFSKLL